MVIINIYSEWSGYIMTGVILIVQCYQGSQHSGKTWKIREKLEKFKKSGKTWKTQGTLSENQRHQGKLREFYFEIFVSAITYFLLPAIGYKTTHNEL